MSLADRSRRARAAPARRAVATVALALALALALAAPPARGQTPAGEYEVKAAFLYNFARFGEWPADAFAAGGRFNICVIGADPFGAALAAIAGKPVGERRVEILRLDPAEDARSCHIAFIAGSNVQSVVAIARRSERLPILTVAELPDFARSGGAIEFSVVDSRVRFSINPAAAQRARVTLSSQLLRLATIVEERR